MKKFLYLLLAVGVCYACKKDKTGTKPLVYFKSYQPDSITPTTELFTLTMRVEDGDGDIEDSIYYAILKDSEIQLSKDTIWDGAKMPNIGQNRGNSVKADVSIPFESIKFAAGYNWAPNDSAHYLIVIRDNAGNKSDTVATPKFSFRRNQ
ncbi:hypothetical protein [Chitinophaga qingshengii]|uniref:DUF4625 domain-containing protein n=1 Tax=Chitinophaga qingshengii TaxID=1569794 RepID=A0ABR7THV3_9BACT|nr:hypothetical protein [Chitinophaga qingshengii]MBC9930081.1 hypothetical protein [Chitinophaga qingshengii]